MPSFEFVLHTVKISKNVSVLRVCNELMKLRKLEMHAFVYNLEVVYVCIEFAELVCICHRITTVEENMECINCRMVTVD